MKSLAALTLLASLFAPPALAAAESPARALYLTHCASCHQNERLGGTGPALLPENLQRTKPEQAAKVVAQGRPATQMPGFADKLSPEEIKSLVDYIFTPLPTPPVWGEAEMLASRVVHVGEEKLPAKPLHGADPLNLFVVVEQGDHHITILDGDKLEPLTRVATRYALHGGPKFSPDGRFVHVVSRDGWVSRFDLHSLQWTAEIRVGINTRNIAVSDDGKTVMAANYLPHTLVALDADTLLPRKIIPVTDGQATSRVSAVYAAPPRRGFIAALKDLPQIWEVPATGDKALAVRAIPAPTTLDDFFFNAAYDTLIGSSRDGGKGYVVDLDGAKVKAEVAIPGMPHLGSGITWERQGRTLLATPNLKENVVTVLDMGDWSLVTRIETPGPGFFMRSHDNAPHAWVDNSLAPAHKDTMTLIDKESLAVAKNLQPAPGKAASHVEFSRDGRFALVSVAEMEGELVIYDTKSLEVVKRLPMKKPSGKYNVYNKITRSSGTSH